MSIRGGEFPRALADRLSSVPRIPVAQRGACLATILASVLCPCVVNAGAVTDSSWGRTPQTLSGTFTIPESMGKLAGTHLFHSFERFSIGTGESATFTTTTAAIQNLISRVSGTEASAINGPLSLVRLNGGSPNFFFINPNGVTFGAGAQIDVPASFHVSTANELRFTDGTVFKAGQGPDSTLAVAVPEAFGFLSATPAGISVDRSTIEVPSGRTLSVVGGDIEVTNGTLKAPGGSVQLTSVGSPGVVAYDQPQQPLDAFPQLGSIKLSGDPRVMPSAIDVSDVIPGSVTVRGNSFELSGAKVSDEALVFGSFDGVVRIEVRDNLTATRGGIDVSSDFVARGADVFLQAKTLTLREGSVVNGRAARAATGGDINVTADTVKLEGTGVDGQRNGLFTTAGANTVDWARAGNISVNAKHLSITTGAAIVADTFGPGAGGDVQIGTPTQLVGSIVLDGLGSSISAATRVTGTTTNATGPGGNVTVWADSLRATGGAQIASSTVSSDDKPEIQSGRAGNVSVFVKDIVLEGGSGSSRSSFLASSEGPNGGPAGNIEIRTYDNSSNDRTGQLTVQNGAQVLTYTDGNHPAGRIIVNGGNIIMEGQEVVLNQRFGAALVNATRGSGGAGDITITAGSLQMRDGAQIQSSQVSTATGRAGSIAIDADTVILQDADSAVPLSTPPGPVGVGINSSAHGTGADAKGAGGVSVTAKTLEIRGRAQILAVTQGVGEGGNIDINADAVTLQGGYLNARAGLFARSEGAGQAGDIRVVARDLRVVDSAQIDVDSRSQGKGGTIDIKADTVVLQGELVPFSLAGGLFAAASGGGPNSGSGGDISVRSGSLELRDGAQISASSLGTGAGGKVAVSADKIVMGGTFEGRRTGIFASSLGNIAGAGAGGDVAIDVATIDMRDGAQINTGTLGPGAAGGVTVTATQRARAGGESGGTIIVDGEDSGILAQAATGSSGQTGSVTVSADRLSVVNGAEISVRNDGVAKDPASVKATTLTITSPEIVMTGGGRITSETSGNVVAARVALMPGADGVGTMSLRGNPATSRGEVTSSTLGAGNAGDIEIRATNLTLSDVELVSAAKPRSIGAAGRITVAVPGKMSLLDGRIATDTFGAGRAGNIAITAGNLLVDPSEISSAARAGSGGQTGSVDLRLRDSLRVADGSSINIRNEAMVDDPSRIAPTMLFVSAPSIALQDGEISSASSGNVDASDIVVSFNQLLRMRNGEISTSANGGSGGAISIAGSGPMLMSSSQITTSVLGNSNGNGGDISIAAPVLVMNTGFIQANTAAPRATGGDINLSVDALIPSGNTLFVGGSEPVTFQSGAFGFNVIQAAAPDGVAGNIQIASPAFDLAGSLAGLETELIDFGALGQDMCRIGAGSSMTRVGRGGQPPSIFDTVRPEYPAMTQKGVSTFQDE